MRRAFPRVRPQAPRRGRNVFRALEAAAAQRARFWELRAALALARLRRGDTAARVAGICATFGQGLGLPELEAARAPVPARAGDPRAGRPRAPSG